VSESDRPGETDALLPLGYNGRRAEVELFDPASYRAHASPPFIDRFVRDAPADGTIVAADLEAYLAWFEPLALATREQRVLHVFMVNRCGSTLLLNALARHPEVAGFNELDPWLADLDGADGDLAARLDRAFGAHIRRWALVAGRTPLLKHRGDTLIAAPRVLAQTPRARAVFLVRHFDHVIASQLARPPSSFPGGALRAIERVAPTALAWDPALAAGVYAAFYLDTIARYRALAASAAGAAVCALRYETLMRAPEAALRAVAAWLELDVDDQSAAAMCAELAFDAKRTAHGDRTAYVAAARPNATLGDAARAALDAAWAQPLPRELEV
jgi:hypothetical protein